MQHEQPNTLTPKLQVDVIDTLAGFRQIRRAWEGLQMRDPESTVFLSWAWMDNAFRANPYRWSVLVVRDPSAPEIALCILPLKYRVHWSQSSVAFHTQIEAGGRLIWSEYTGFLCDPSFEEAALRAAAQALSQMPWTQISMRYVMQERRTKLFLDQFADTSFSIRYKSYKINKGETDNLLCPQVDLPDKFDTYLEDQISASRRQRHRRTMRHRFDNGPYRIAHTTPETLTTDLDAILGYWSAKWIDSKGTDTTAQVAGNYRDVLTAALLTDTLFLPILYRNNHPIGGLGHILDHKNGVMHFIVAGRDPEAEEGFINEALHFHSIAHAIDNEYICYDFGHGNEPYKYSYGAVDQKAQYFEIRRRNGAPEDVFDVMCTGMALRRIEEFLQTGKQDQATKACAQLANLMS